jgi:hypothetical protein
MKLEKFMCEVTKALVRDKRVMFWEYGDKVVISNDGCFAMIIPKIRNVFNREFSNCDKIPYDWYAHKLEDTLLSTMIEKTTVHIFETDKGEKIHVNEKYLNYFDPRFAEFYGEQKSAVFVSEDGGKTPCGIIMPIWIGERKNKNG